MSDAGLVELLHSLRSHSYRFTAVTPATHATVLARSEPQRVGLRDIFGWNRRFGEQDLEPSLMMLLERAGALESMEGGRFRSRVRVASLGDDLFVHSAFPTDDMDSVFFGPDTYRFCRFVGQSLPSDALGHIVDMGAGAGAGGIAVARRSRDAKITFVDVNPQALRYATINAAAAGLEIEGLQSDQVPAGFDLLIGNAPYLMDSSGRAYCDGGQLLGGSVSLDWILQGLEKLGPGCRIFLYTAAAYVDGRAPLLLAIQEECRAASASLTIDEIDPDVFGEELGETSYAAVERIAVVGIIIARAGR